MATPRTIEVNERPPLLQALPLSLQHLFAMFGATVLVPFLVGLDTSVTLFSSGVGTLIYIALTKGKIPAYLGSSFAFIAAMAGILGVQPGQIAPDDRIAIVMGGCFAAGLVYLVVAGAVWKWGVGWIDRLLPPVVIGSVVMVIGLGLARVAVVSMAMNGGGPAYRPEFFMVALAALAIAILAAVFLKGFLGVIPVLIGIIGGYVVALLAGQVSFEGVRTAAPLAVPPFVWPTFTLGAIVTITPIALVTITEHIGHLIVTNKIVGRDFMKDPGLHRSLAGDGIATSAAALIGGPPNTTYGENIGVMAIIRSIPTQVMGGICILLFGIIASAGIRMLVEAGIDFSQKRNLIIASVVLVIGIGGAEIHLGSIKIDAMPLATYVGIILNLILPKSIGEKQVGEADV